LVFGVPVAQIAALAVELFKMTFIAVLLAATACIAVLLAAILRAWPRKPSKTLSSASRPGSLVSSVSS
jgi:hypothetical protein